MFSFYIFLFNFQIFISLQNNKNNEKYKNKTFSYLLSSNNDSYSNKCQIGKNNCIVCSQERNLCEICDEDYFPDENGGCSYTENCEISQYGSCIKCKSNYILIGIEDYYKGGIKICKSLNTEDLQNCNSINYENGICYYCKEGYYLNSGDKKCIKIENCYQSSYGTCIKCTNGYYLDRIENKCKMQNGIFKFCIESNDGKKCSLCDKGYYLSENGLCSFINFCKKFDIESEKCEKCISGYYLTGDEYACTPEKNCFSGDENFGICNLCKNNYYIDIQDRKCKSNQEENDLKYCQKADGSICIKCAIEYGLGEDHKCSTSYDCKKSINTTCIECIDTYHLSLNNICTNVEHCIYASFFILGCVECEEKYYYNQYDMECQIAPGNFNNCKSSEDLNFCQRCKDNFYLNLTDNLCYNSIIEENGKFYKCSQVNISEEENEYKCIYCLDDYYLGEIDNKCTTMEGCDLSENENKCLECDLGYCLNLKTNKCIPNDEIISEELKYYFRCLKTNKDGNKCEICFDDYILDENGLCIDEEHCIEKIDGKCKKCQNDEFEMFCVNEYFGCEEILTENCLECNNNFDLFKCTKCFEGYELNNNDKCVKIEGS